jgi:protein TonB
MREKDVFSDAFLSQPSLVSRLLESFREARREFIENPGQYLTAAVRGEGIGGHLRVDRLRFGLSLAVAMYMMLLGLSIILSSVGRRPESPTETLVTRLLINPGRGPANPPPGDSDKDAGGGGGGGRGELRPASIGVPPPFLLTAPIMAPTTRAPIEPPSLPMPETLLGIPEPHVDAPTGIETGTPGPPSDGPGSDGGVGTGNQGGVGPGHGPGAGPGDGGGERGGPFGPGRRRQGVDALSLSSKPIPLNRPRPSYTEEARKQRVQGVVRAKVLVGPDGSVKSVHIQSGLPDGLDEEAIRAAYQMRFRPALSSGRPVEAWVTLEIEFNLR